MFSWWGELSAGHARSTASCCFFCLFVCLFFVCFFAFFYTMFFVVFFISLLLFFFFLFSMMVYRLCVCELNYVSALHPKTWTYANSVEPDQSDQGLCCLLGCNRTVRVFSVGLMVDLWISTLDIYLCSVDDSHEICQDLFSLKNTKKKKKKNQTVVCCSCY